MGTSGSRKVRLFGAIVLNVGWAFACEAQEETIPLEEGLVAYWTFDDHFGEFLGRRHGVQKGERPITFDKGKFGSGVFLNGDHQHLEIAGNESDFDFLDGNPSFSVAAWFRSDGSNEWAGIVSKGESEGWGLARRGSADDLTFFSGGKMILPGYASVWPDFAIHHIVGVMDRKEGMRLYVDGELAGKRASKDVADSTLPLMIGARVRSSGQTWSGMIDEVAIWNRALDGEDAARLWAEGAGLNLASIIPDEDGDGLPDFWESENALSSNSNDAAADPDGDGLSNLEEFHRKSDPRSQDSDEDGLPDAVETLTGRWSGKNDRGTDPQNPDSDGDGPGRFRGNSLGSRRARRCFCFGSEPCGYRPGRLLGRSRI